MIFASLARIAGLPGVPETASAKPLPGLAAVDGAAAPTSARNARAGRSAPRETPTAARPRSPARALYERSCSDASDFESHRHAACRADPASWPKQVLALCAQGEAFLTGRTLRSADWRYTEYRTDAGALVGTQLYRYDGDASDLDASTRSERTNLAPTAPNATLAKWRARLDRAFRVPRPPPPPG